jgi:hypothetical protein
LTKASRKALLEQNEIIKQIIELETLKDQSGSRENPQVSGFHLPPLSNLQQKSEMNE